MIGELEPLAHRLLGALVNGAVHGLLLTGFVWLIWKTRPRVNAATRHAVGFATLVAVALLPAGHFLLSPGDDVTREEVRPGKGSGVGESVLTRMGVPSPDTRLPETLNAGESDVPGTGRSGVPVVEDQLGDIAGGTERADESAPVKSDAAVNSWHDFNQEWERRSGGVDATNASAVAGLVASRAHSVVEPAGAIDAAGTMKAGNAVVPDWRWIWRSELRGEISLALACLWLGIAVFRLGVLIRQVGWLLRLKRRAQTVEGSAGELFQALCEEVRPGRRIKLLSSRGTTTPLAAGFLSPAVVLPSPASGLGGSAQVESILRHELAHVRRRDDWTNLIQQGIRAVYFFNPAVWWLSRRLTVDREIACDDHVLAARGTPREYAMFLAEFASRIQGRDWVAAPAAWSHQSQLKERIDMLLDTQRNKSTRLARAGVGTLTAITVLIAAAGLHAGPRLTFEPAGETVVTTTETVDVTPALAMEAPVVRPVVTIETAYDSGATRRVTGSAFVYASEVDDSTISIEPAPGGRSVQLTSGPRFKARAGIAPPAPVEPVAPANTPTAPFVPTAPQPHPPAPHPAPVPPMASVGWDHRGHDQESMEQRLDRLERLVESLVEQKGGAKVPGRSGADPLFERRHKELELHIAHPDIDVFQTKRIKIPEVEWEQMARQQKETERDVRQLERHSERLAREAARKSEAEAHALARRHPAGPGQSLMMRQRELEQQRAALDAERRAMEKQRAALEAQLQRIEKQLNQLDQQRHKLEPEVEVEVEIDARELKQPGVDGGGFRPEGDTQGSDNPFQRR